MNVAFGVVKSIALYVFLSLPVSIWVFGVKFSDATTAAADPESFAEWFLASSIWALPVLLATVAFNAFAIFIRQRFFRRDRSGGITASVFGGLRYALINPFHGLRAPVVNAQTNDLTGIPWAMSKGYSILHFCWAIALIAYLALGFLAVS